jgi:hypothetical protein
MMFWWQQPDGSKDARSGYQMVTSTEMRRLRLQPVLDYARDLAELSRLDWFSTELCLSERPGVSRHTVPGADGSDWPVLALDYVNDRCNMEVCSRQPGALPDDVVRRIAVRCAEEAWRVRQQAIRPESVRSWRAAA